MTGEIDRDEERREKPPNQQKEEREKLHSSIIYALLLSFYFGRGETVEWRKWRFPVLLLFLSPTTTKANRGFFPLPFLSGVGISNQSMIMSVPPFLSHNPLMCSFAFCSFTLFVRGRGQPGHMSTAGQPISSPSFISLSCLMLRNFHIGEVCQIA